jgi:pimeloyl-ACP methyl ester carboxylesterase
VLLLGHGGGQSKDAERFVAFAQRFADGTGMAVACIDAVDHGERRPSGATNDLPARWHSNAIPQMVLDWQATAEHLAPIGPVVAYVGFSMGAMFGMPTVAAMPTITAAVFVSGGIPGGGWTDDPPLRSMLLDAAAHLDHTDVAMLNMSGDALFPVDEVRHLFEAVHAKSKQLQFWDGDHDDWSPALIDEAIAFVTQHASKGQERRFGGRW